MRLLVHEFATGGGLIGRDVPPSLGREGAAMLGALVRDLAAANGREIVTTIDPRFTLSVPSNVEVVTLPQNRARAGAVIARLMREADAVWLVAPETGRCLELLASRVERTSAQLLGPGSIAIRRAADKAALPRLLKRLGVPHPQTRVVRAWHTAPAIAAAAREVGFPLVVKPALGAGCEGVRLVQAARDLPAAVRAAGAIGRRGPILIQEYVRGTAASVSLLAHCGRAVPLALNSQSVRAAGPFSYGGGQTPFAHPLAERAVDAAAQVCRALPGLRGYVGVDLVLGAVEPVVIEVNPRLTTAYLGVRRAIRANVAALAVAACGGHLSDPPEPARTVRFRANGRIAS